MNEENIMQSRHIKTAVIIFLVVATVFLGFKTLSAMKYLGESDLTENRPMISVQGTGEVTAVADTATITVTVMENAKTTAEAQRLATDKTNKVIAYLKGAGIEDKDVKTLGYHINPRYSQGPQIYCIKDPCPSPESVITGYDVSQTIQIKVRKVDEAGTILGGIGKLNVQNVYGPDLTIDNPEELQAEARAKAIADAKAKAEVLADQLGVRVVRIINYAEQGSGMPYYGLQSAKLEDARGGAGPVSNPVIPKGENTITSNVTITFEIR